MEKKKLVCKNFQIPSLRNGAIVWKLEWRAGISCKMFETLPATIPFMSFCFKFTTIESAVNGLKSVILAIFQKSAVSAAFQNHPENLFSFHFLFHILIGFLFWYETIARRRAWSWVHSNPNPSSVFYLKSFISQVCDPLFQGWIVLRSIVMVLYSAPELLMIQLANFAKSQISSLQLRKIWHDSLPTGSISNWKFYDQNQLLFQQEFQSIILENFTIKE